MYARLAHLYDNVARDVFSAQAAAVTQEEIDRLLMLTSDAPALGPPKFSPTDRAHLRVADLACGTGLLSWLVAGQGPQVVGLDVAEAMLEVARERTPPAETPPQTRPPQFLHADILAHELTPKADIALCFGDVVNHLMDAQEIETLFANTARGLKDGGLFVLDATDRSTFEGILWNSEVMEAHSDGTKLKTHVTFDDNSEKAVMTFSSWNEGADTEGPPDHVEEVHERFYPTDVLRSALEANGFDQVRTRPWRPFAVIDGSIPLTKTLFVARRR